MQALTTVKSWLAKAFTAVAVVVTAVVGLSFFFVFFIIFLAVAAVASIVIWWKWRSFKRKVKARAETVDQGGQGEYTDLREALIAAARRDAQGKGGETIDAEYQVLDAGTDNEVISDSKVEPMDGRSNHRPQ